MFNTHVCMVSAQAAPNYLPLLDEKLRPKEVILLVTPEMESKALYLKKEIEPLGIKVRTETIEATGSFDKTQESIMDLLKGYAPESIALNATGGTKWMAISVQEVFRMNNSPVFYVDIATGNILLLDKKANPIRIGNTIKLKNYLRIYGYQIEKESPAIGLTEGYKIFCSEMVKNVAHWGKAIGYLNSLAQQAEQEKSLKVKFDSYAQSDIKALLDLAWDSELLKYNEKEVTFSDDKARHFLNGGWIEYYVNSCLNALKSEGVLQDSSYLGLHVVSPKGTKNELDVAFMANNRLHIIECKTKRLSGSKAGAAGAESIYKLDSLSDLGGIGTKSMLISYRNLGEGDLRRAKELRIKTVEAGALLNLKEKLREWIANN